MNDRLRSTRLVLSSLAVMTVAGVLVGLGRAEVNTKKPPELTMALTFDDLIGQTTIRTTENYAAINSGILNALRDADAPAIGFVNETRLYEGGELVAERVAILRRWLEQGLELGNHTYSHPNLHEVPVEDWLADMDRGETVLRTLWDEFPPERRYLRHPFLRTGQSDEVRAQVTEHLARKEYAVAPVTIDNQEWIFARAYDVAVDRNDAAAADAVVVAYLQYMDEIVAYYEEQSDKIVGRQIPQVLLVHANRLNAVALPQLLAGIAKRGYRFNDLEEALADTVFARPDGYYGPAGITGLHRWAIADGMPGSTFAGEPDLPEFVRVLSGL
jgi:peptidoglycan/xylan/chitin deacetylase (PgdA/CDA1 family)